MRLLSTHQTKGNTERMLLEHIDRLRKYPEDRIAVHICLSMLQAQNRREHHMRVAASTFEQFVSQHEGQMFVLHNHDIVFVGRSVAISQIEKGVTRLKYLFNEDPLFQFETENSQPDFAYWWRLDSDFDAFYAAIRKLYRMSLSGKEIAEAEPKKLKDCIPLNTESLAKLEAAISQADLSNFIRNQSACMIADDGKTRQVFDEIFVSIGELQQTLLPKMDLTFNRWLFLHLTQTLDKRLLL
ncbi:MAG: hypothetical protein U9N14_06785 [Pseudomonadota bacterium]|nr:hypothetical protein [Pseudomonadota bacterium]